MTDERQPVESVTRGRMVEILQAMEEKVGRASELFSVLRDRTEDHTLSSEERDLLSLEVLHMQMLTMTGVATLMQQQVNYKDQMREA